MRITCLNYFNTALITDKHFQVRSGCRTFCFSRSAALEAEHGEVPATSSHLMWYQSTGLVIGRTRHRKATLLALTRWHKTKQ